MKTSETITEITKAYMECQKELKNLSPDANGYNYKYLTLHKLIKETKPILMKNNIVCVQSVGQTEIGVSITTRLQHVSGEYFEDTFSLPPTNSKSMNDVQAMGSSISYGRRYGMGTMLGISVDDDDDGNVVAQKSNNYNNKKQPDFNEIDKELKECKTDEDIEKYRIILWNEFPNMSKAQIDGIKPKFDKRRKEISTVNNKLKETVKKEFQGEVFNDDNIPY